MKPAPLKGRTLKGKARLVAGEMTQELICFVLGAEEAIVSLRIYLQEARPCVISLWPLLSEGLVEAKIKLL